MGATRPGSASTISSEHIKASILSAVEDKVRRRLGEDFSICQAECESLRRTQEEMGSSIRVLESKKEEMEEMLDKIDEGDEISCDEAVDASCPLYKQLMSAFAEEAA